MPLNELIPEFDTMLEDFVYEKIWSELSAYDRKVISALALNGKMKTQDVQKATGTTSSSFSTYRKRLKEKGLVDTSEYGYLNLSLPRFAEIVKSWM